MGARKNIHKRTTKKNLGDLRGEVRKLLIQNRVESILGDLEDCQLEAVDDTVRRLMDELGAKTRMDTPPLLDAVQRHFGWSREDFQEAEQTNSSLPIDAEAAYAAWVNEAPGLEVLDPSAYKFNGGYDRHSVIHRLHNDRKIPNAFGGLLRFGGDPVVFTAILNERFGVWQISAHGVRTDRFLAEWQRRTDGYLVERYRGKLLDLKLNEIDLKTYAREDLIYPRKLGRQVDDMLTSFRSWAENDRVPRWGYVLIGGPGTGKTTIGGLLAGAKLPGVTLLYCPAGQIENAKQIDQLFRMAKLLSPAIIQIDDIDLISGDRNEDGDAYTSTLMENLDGLEAGARIFTVFTTNDPSGMDDAVINRAGRTSNKIVFENFGECFDPLLAKYVSDYKLRIAEKRRIDVVKTMSERVTDFTPDEVKNVCQRLALLYGERTVPAQGLRDAIEETYQAFHGTAADRTYLRRRKRSGDEESED